MRSRLTILVAGPGLLAGVLVATAPAHAAVKSGPTLTVDVTAGRHHISSDIYGMNFAPARLARDLGLTLDRWGGNATSRYNYQHNISNTASDWYFENIPNSTSLTSFIHSDLSRHTQPLVTVPMIGWVAKSSSRSHPYACGFNVKTYGAQQSTDPYDPNCGNGVGPSGQPIHGNDPTDTSRRAGPGFVTAMVKHLVSTFGRAGHGGVRTYELDNEPTLWNSTHRDVHPKPLTYAELWSKSRDTALGIKAVDPGAKVDGPGDWGWCAYFFSAADPGGCGDGRDRKAHGDQPLAAWYLRQFHAYQRAHHKRLLDYFDEHFYPQESGVALSPAGNQQTQALRLRSTRALWDPSYKDESWTSDLGLGPVKLIRRMRAWRDHYYPGTKLAISEYNWGGLEAINGALAEADVLGIFGREHLDRALLWSPPSYDQPGAFAFRMYRNYDGHRHRFGDVGVKAVSADQGRLSVYAAQRSSDGATTILVINKTSSPLTAPLHLRGVNAPRAQVFTYSAADRTAIVRHPTMSLSGTTLRGTYSANSITLLVLPHS